MIAFASLFLGLVFGPQQVELVVDDAVARVEVRLDGATVATVRQAPWKVGVDLGEELAPHRLEALAFDHDGQAVGRAERWLNLPLPPADASLVLETDDGGRATAARLSWQSLAGAEPLSVAVSLDGRPLEVDDPRRIALPAHEPAQLHFLRAELRFAENVSSVVEATFGGTYQSQVNTELTAVPAVGPRRRMRDPQRLQGLFRRRGGETLTVVAADRAPALAVVVLDRGTTGELLALTDRFSGLSALRPEARIERLVAWSPLGAERFLRILWPVSRRQSGVGRAFDLFPSSLDFPCDRVGVLYQLYWAERPPHHRSAPQRLADAVAVAGLEAAGSRRPRAVVLVLSGRPEDRSAVDPARVRRFLARLKVPLLVWTTAPTPPPDRGWGPARDVSVPLRLQRAVGELGETLGEQWIVWLDGTHLPQDVVLAGSGAGLRLAE